MPAVQLATKDEVKEILTDLKGNTDYDALLDLLIGAVSGHGDVALPLGGFEAVCDRIFTKAVHTQYCSSDGLRKRLRVLAYPIVSISTIWVDTAGTFGAGTSEQTTEYFADRRGGPWIHRRDTVWTRGEQHIKIAYTGGLWDAVGQVPSDVKEAVALQVTAEFRRRKNFEISSESVASGSIVHMGTLEVVPRAAQLLHPFRFFG